ncbi:MAG: hypothetical protein CME70_10590 [Halobacteriovorax sp.]|nr:hypothetical protein [Halobacteriovorax sp.]
MYKFNFNHLHYFMTIAREGSIVKASKKLHITQPALSHQLKLFEEDLGEKLFDRKGKRLAINDHGRKVLEYGDRIFRQSDELQQVIKTGEISTSKIVKVGVISWLPAEHVYEFIRPLLYMSQIKVQIIQKDLASLLKDVQTDALDLILCDSPYSGRSKKLMGKKIHSEPIICLASSNEKLKGKFPANINSKKAISYSEASEIRDHVDGFILDNNLSLNIVGELSDASLALYAIEKGDVIGFLPLTKAKEALRGNRVKKLGEISKARFSLWAIYKKNQGRSSIITNLIKRND